MPVVISNSRYRMLYDHGRPLCFVGDTVNNHLLYGFYSRQGRPCTKLSLEEVDSRDDDWFKENQLMSVATSISFKILVRDTLQKHNPMYFSAIGESCMFGFGVNVGYNVMMHHYVELWDRVTVGDHCTIASQIDFAHGTNIGDLCQIGPLSNYSYANLGTGVSVGSQAFVFAGPHSPLCIADYTNICADSRVLKSIDEAGTYVGNRKKDDRTSLQLTL